jgi:hypothetical protein
MTDSTQETDSASTKKPPNQDTPSTSLTLPEPPAATFVTGTRRISLDAYGVKKIAKNSDSVPELDDFGLPIRKKRSSRASSLASLDERPKAGEGDGNGEKGAGLGLNTASRRRSRSARESEHGSRSVSVSGRGKHDDIHEQEGESAEAKDDAERGRSSAVRTRSKSAQRLHDARSRSMGDAARAGSRPRSRTSTDTRRNSTIADEDKRRSRSDTLTKIMEAGPTNATGGVSEWSHQALAPKKEEVIEEKEEEWQDMPALGEYDVFDDEGNLIAKGHVESDEEGDHGGAGKGYTRVQIDDDAKSTTSMDENTSYLFKEKGTNVVYEDEEQRDALAQMEATKDLLTEGQRIAYVGVARLAMITMLNELEKVSGGKTIKKDIANSTEGMKLWSQKMMVRLYGHMDIDAAGLFI